MTVNLIIVFALIVLNGVFALAELAVVSSRRAKLEVLQQKGRAGATSALALHGDPGRFLSSVQIGITLVATLNGAFSGQAFGEAAAVFLSSLGIPEQTAATAGFAGVIVIVTYLSVVIGELVPKSLALRNPEAIACVVARPMRLFARIAAPAVWLLDASTKLVMRLFGSNDDNGPTVTDAEIKSLISEAERSGVVEGKESEMISGVMRLADRRVSGVMTPRTEIEWIDVTASHKEIRKLLTATEHAYLPAADDDMDHVVGVIRTRDALAALLRDDDADIKSTIRQAIIVPESAGALDVLERMREATTPVAFVHDEYGNFEGLVTPVDILEAIAGGFAADLGTAQPYAKQRADGSWLLSGAMAVDEAADLLGFDLPDKRDYQTLAGFVLEQFKRLPETGEHVTAGQWRIEVIDLDGNRIDMLLASMDAITHRAKSADV